MTSTSETRVIVADDEEMIRKLVTMQLERNGLAVATVSSGGDALELLASDSAFDLFIVDMNMPGLNGLETAQQARQAHPDLPILLATGNAAALTPDDLRHYGVDGILGKPFRMAELIEKIESTIADHAP